ncbi:hypothetical protein VTK26DRAFT_8828 [Humicola hyalothermophila]
MHMLLFRVVEEKIETRGGGLCSSLTVQSSPFGGGGVLVVRWERWHGGAYLDDCVVEEERRGGAGFHMQHVEAVGYMYTYIQCALRSVQVLSEVWGRAEGLTNMEAARGRLGWVRTVCLCNPYLREICSLESGLRGGSWKGSARFSGRLERERRAGLNSSRS